MKSKFIKLFSDIASRTAEMSSAKRLKVGAIIVKDDRIISLGYNGMPAGWDNNCEYKDYAPTSDRTESDHEYPLKDEQGQYRLKTRPEVLHAEMNALMKLAKSTESGENASLFITHAPCLECAKGIYQSGIKEIYYREQYRSTSGLEFLQNCGINITKVSDV
jgi:dCMP deaminase